MPKQSSFKNEADAPAAALRKLASQAYRVLRDEAPQDRCEVLSLLDQIGEVRQVFESEANAQLLHWFDQLEVQVGGLLDDSDSDVMYPSADPSHCHGVGVA
ncbi:hypothetical protein [Tautonia marina]|uniref:hypothetical protein n=1 Tax=Tautonia marina TaxID=2653855 RepID=UPI001260FE7F|nr:hypothetical protein [Tautonia marina]